MAHWQTEPGARMIHWRLSRSHLKRTFHVALWLHFQPRLADRADQVGLKQPIQEEYQRRFRRDICEQGFDLPSGCRLCRECLTFFLRESRQELKALDGKLAVGGARGDDLGASPGRSTLDWRKWFEDGLIDAVVVNANYRLCPTTSYQLWSMHRGYGSLQNNIHGDHLPSSHDRLRGICAPGAGKSDVWMFIARQWDQRSAYAEKALRKTPAVSGPVFGSLRDENPAALVRGEWRVQPVKRKGL